MRSHGRALPPTQAASSALSKLDMTVTSDDVTAAIRIKFNRKPQCSAEEQLLDDMKGLGFKWIGYAEKGRWQHPDKEAVVCFQDKSFCARIKKVVKNISFYAPSGESVDLLTFIDEVKSFNMDEVDGDLSTLGKSSVPPDTPAKDDNKRQRTD